jgi:hypothetical protein
MLRETWWWPWWVSSLIDLGVVVAALAMFGLTGRRAVRALAVVFVLAGLVAAILAPVVMTEQSDRRMRDAPAMLGRAR